MTLDEDDCQAAILDIFEQVAALTPMQIAHGLDAIPGKLYELYCLGRVLELLQVQGYSVVFQGTSLRLQTSGGFANPSQPHFEIWNWGTLFGLLYTDVEVGVLSALIDAQNGGSGINDLSAYHEIDLVLLAPGHAQWPHRPSPAEMILGVECKAVADFKKLIVREVLGRRRELSLLAPANSGPLEVVPANPPSSYWLAHIDPLGSQYIDGPRAFGVAFHNWIP
jgi:hypothetical protein